jgi:hypothetical protein
MRAKGGDIKTKLDRHLMSDQKRFKQKRDFKTRLGEQPEERELTGDRNFGKGKYAREDRRFGRRDGEERGGRFGRRNGEGEKDFKRGDFKRSRDGEGNKDLRRGNFKRNHDDKRGAEKRDNKSFNKFRRDDRD